MYITNLSMGSLAGDMASITITYIELGWAKQDAVLKAKELTGTNRKLTEDEKIELANLIHIRFPQISITDLMYSINLAESMPGYSSGGAGDTDQNQTSSNTLGFLIYLVIGIVLLMGLKK